MSVPPDLRHHLREESRSLPSARFTLDEVKQRARRRNILRQSALAATAVAVAALLILSSRLLPLTEVPLADRIEPAAAEPVELAGTYFTAINQTDRDLLMRLWDPEAPQDAADISPFLRDSREDDRVVVRIRSKLELLAALERRYESVVCREAGGDPAGAIVVRCDYRMSDRLLEAIGAGPVRGSLDIHIAQGSIVRTRNEAHPATEDLEAFAAWLEEERVLDYLTSCDIGQFSGSVCAEFLLDTVDQWQAAPPGGARG